jgi:hypothetical protein
VHESAARESFEAFVRAHWSALMSIGVAVSGSRVEAEDLVQSALTNTYPKWRRIRPEDALAYLRRSVLKCPHQPVAAASRRRAHGRRAARADGIRRRDERSGRAARAAARPAPRAGPAAQRAGAALPVRPARRRVRRARAGRRRPGLPAAEQVLAPGRHGEPDAASSTAPPPDSSHRPDDFSVEDPGTAPCPDGVTAAQRGPDAADAAATAQRDTHDGAESAAEGTAVAQLRSPGTAVDVCSSAAPG